MRLILGLDEITAADGSRVGGKAVALASLEAAGQRVPRTLCLTTEAYRLFVEEASLRPVIYQELGRKSFADMRWEELWDVALRIRNRFLRAPIPPVIIDELTTRLEMHVGSGPYAVRSSALGEDAAGASFAGLHDSYVGVQGADRVAEAIRKVWSSLWTDRALLYRRELGIDVESSAMAVLVQEMIEGQTSGIVFGRHPSQADLVVIEAVYGLNQGLVDGTIEPDRWSLEQATGRVVEHGIPESRQRCVARDGDLVTEPVPADKAALPPLDSRAIETVYRAVLGAEAIFRAPQDMEWTFRAADLVLLQSRPVTTSSTGEGDKRSWYLSLTRSLETIEGLRARVEQELLPTMVKDAEASAGRDLADLDPEALAAEIERRRQLHDHWVEVYSREFIPLAHGVRIFGQFYNDTLKPDDPYAFMELLVATPLLSVRRNRALEALAARLRSDTRLRKNLQAGEAADSDFEGELLDFERQFGSLSYESERCFADRARLVRLLISMAEAPARQARSAGPDLEQLTESFQDAVDPGRRPLARKLLDLARAAYRIRDDDNLYLSRLEAQVLEAVEEGRGRLEPRPDSEGSDLDPEGIVRALRHPNRVVEPRSEIEEIDTEPGFRVVPRQLVGQPAGPGVATGPARIVDGAGDLFDFQAGEVLVCDAVDPNMTFVVPMASAVIERRGGMLIHGAIIAREYGLACVTGVPNATSLISNGDRLTVDGFLGIVTVSKG